MTNLTIDMEKLDYSTEKELFRQLDHLEIDYTYDQLSKNSKTVEDINFLKQTVNKYNRQLEKCANFIESIESQTNEWDKLCDCGCENGIHDDDCMTFKIRKDVENLFTEDK